MSRKEKTSKDKPIDNRDDDKLEYSKYAKVLADASDRGEVIGIFGDWGVGKSSLLNLIKQEIKEKGEKYITVFFEAWKYEKEAYPLIPLVNEILKRIKENQNFGVNVKEIIRKVPFALSAIIEAIEFRAGASGQAAIKIGDEENQTNIKAEGEFGAKISVGQVLKNYKEHLNKNRLQQTLYEFIYEIFEGIKKELEKNKNESKVIVFIDDLDRTMPDKALELLESLKLILNQDFLTYYIALNKNIIEKYIKIKLEKILDEKTTDNYLEKLIHVSFFIPKLTRPNLKTFYEDYLEALSDNDNIFDRIEKNADFRAFIFEISNFNPRKLKRFLNNSYINFSIYSNDTANNKEQIDFYYFVVSYIFSVYKLHKYWLGSETNKEISKETESSQSIQEDIETKQSKGATDKEITEFQENKDSEEKTLFYLFIERLKDNNNNYYNILNKHRNALEDYFKDENKRKREISLYFSFSDTDNSDKSIEKVKNLIIILGERNDPTIKNEIKNINDKEIFLLDEEKIKQLKDEKDELIAIDDEKDESIILADLLEDIKNKKYSYVYFFIYKTLNANIVDLINRVVDSNIEYIIKDKDEFVWSSSHWTHLNNEAKNKVSKKYQKKYKK